MNNDTFTKVLPSLVEGVFSDKKLYIDNLFASTWKSLNFKKIITSSGFSKRSGIQITEAVFVLLLWKWLNVSSIGMFSRKAMSVFSVAKKDVLYDLLKREDINWREFNLRTAKEVYKSNAFNTSRIKTFVLDDSIKSRRGKKMEGVSCHFDHVTNRYVMGQQVLTLGLATDEAFIPLDSQIYVSSRKAKSLNYPYNDGRSIAAKRYEEATEQSKPDMAIQMLQRAHRHGLKADYIVADAWFGTKTMVRGALDLNVSAILRMKKGPLKYRVAIKGKGKRLLAAKELYAQVVKREWKKVRGLPWKAVAVDVELDLSVDKQKTNWTAVQLLFVRGLKEPEDSVAGKKDWALFLATDVQLSISKILEVYALRWGIEVYFKEAKQHLGFLAEQTTTFASHTASIHLCAVRYLMLVHATLNHCAEAVGQARSTMQDQVNLLSFAGKLWGIFRAIITGTLHELANDLGCSVEYILQAIDTQINMFFIRSLQLDTFTMQLEHEKS